MEADHLVVAKRLRDGELTHRIIGSAITVHQALGPGFIERAYHNALVIELDTRGLSVGTEVPIPIVYRGVEVAQHRLDLLVEDRIIVELKAVGRVSSLHFAVVRSYLKAAALRDALILNFAARTLEVRRVDRR